MTIEPKELADMIAEAIDTACDPLLERIKALEGKFGVQPPSVEAKQGVSRPNNRIEELEGRLANVEARATQLETEPRGLVYTGPWELGKSYRRHEGVTHSGS